MSLTLKLAAAADLGGLLMTTLTSPRKAVQFYRSYYWESHIPVVDHRQLGGPMETCDLSLKPVGDEYGDMTWQESVVVSMLVRKYKPLRMFEIGTFMGKTTYHLIANAPDSAEVFTLDLPEEGFREIIAAKPYDRHLLHGGKRQEVGFHYKNSSFAKRVVQLFADSRKFDPGALANSMDLVFVDADHSYESARADTELALKLLDRRGSGKILLWHDLRPGTGVECAMLDVFPAAKVFRLQDTALGIHIT